MPAPKSEPTTTPVRMRVRIGSRPRTHEPIATTSATAARPPGEREALDGDDGQREEDREPGAQRAAGGHAEDVGRDERVLEEVLVGGAGGGERGAHGEGGDEPRGAHLQDDRLDVAPRGRLAAG